MTRKRKGVLLQWIAALTPALLAAALYFLAGSRDFSNWYARHIFPLWTESVGRFFGIFPFSVMEIVLCLLILICLIFFVRDMTRIVRKRVAKGAISRFSRFLLIAAGSFLLIFMLGAGVNYNRSPFSEDNHLRSGGGTKEELYHLCLILAEGTNELADQVRRDENQIMQLEPGFEQAAVEAMRSLSKQYDTLKGYYSRPKPVLFSEFLSHQNVTGIHSPFTAEAQYNRVIVPYNIPHTICHELSHLKGYMREDEANFVAYLACLASDRKDFNYSAYLLGYIYATNALSGADRDAFMKVRGMMKDGVNKDLEENNRYWARYQTQLAKIHESVNNAYLKINRQEDGVKSYGRVVDLLLAYYHEDIVKRMAGSEAGK